MVSVGYTLMTEQAGPMELVGHAIAAERAGSDFAVCSDHYFPSARRDGPLPERLGHPRRERPGHRADRPDDLRHRAHVRYRPWWPSRPPPCRSCRTTGSPSAWAPGRHSTNTSSGTGCPSADTRQARLVEAATIIAALFDGGYVNVGGRYFRIDSAKLWDRPTDRVPIGIAVSGEQSCTLFAPLAVVMIGIEPDLRLGRWWEAAPPRRIGAARKVAQLPISWDEDRDAAVREDDIADQIPCGTDVDAVLRAAAAFIDAGFTVLALVQIGGGSAGPPVRRRTRSAGRAARDSTALTNQPHLPNAEIPGSVAGSHPRDPEPGGARTPASLPDRSRAKCGGGQVDPCGLCTSGRFSAGPTANRAAGPSTAAAACG